MENVPPPLPQEKPPFLTLTGSVGLVLVALSAAAASWLSMQEPGALAPGRLLLGIGGVAVGLLGVGFSLVAERHTGAQRIVFYLSLAIGLGAVALEVQSLSGPMRKIVTQTRRALRGGAASDEEALPSAGAPIPNAPGALTLNDVEPYYRAWIEEKVAGGYDAHGLHSPKWDATARKFVAGWLQSMLQLREAPDAEQLAVWSRELEAAKCTDPLVRLAIGSREKGVTRSEWFLTRAADGLAKAGYAPGLVALARAELWKAQRKSNAAAADAQVPQMTAALRDELAAAPLGEREYWMWNYLLTLGPAEDFFDHHSQAVVAALEPLPTVQPWFKQMLRGAGEIEMAWQARGSGYSNTVTAEGWAGFERHLATAREELTKSWTAHPQHPAAAQLMIRVALGHSDQPAEEMRQWFDRAVTARFDYYNAYKQLLWGLRPRWHGSHEAMLAFGHACAETKRYDTIVPWQAFVAARDVASEWDQPDAFYREEAPYAELREMCLAYAGDPKAPQKPAFYLSHLALIAAASEKGDDVLETLAKLQYRLDGMAAGEWSVDPILWPASYAARTGPIAGRMREADEAELRGEFTAAVEALQLAASTPKLDESLRTFVEEKMKAVEKLRVLEKAPWEPLLTPERVKDAGWVCLSGSWSQPDAETLELHGEAANYSSVYTGLQPGSIYEVRGEIEHGRGNSDISSGVIALGWPEVGRDPWLLLRFQKRKGSTDQVIFRQAQGADRIFPAQLSAATNQFSIRVIDGRMITIVNGQRVMDTLFPPSGDASGQPPALSFGTSQSKQPSTVRFRRVEWRRVAAAQ